MHKKLVAMGYTGSERTTRRVVAALKANYSRQNHRIYKPWITEPGMWLQYDFGAGPVIDGVKRHLVLCVARLEPVQGDHPAGRPRASVCDLRARQDVPD